MEKRGNLFNQNVAYDKVILFHHTFSIYMLKGRYIYYLFYVYAKQKKSGIGIQLNKNFPNIPHLIFADDCILFCKAAKMAAHNSQNILNHYCKISGQVVNLHKSNNQFSTGINNADTRAIKQISQINIFFFNWYLLGLYI